MLSYLLIIKEAVYLFPFIALIFSIPYILYNYHKFGSFFSIRVFIIYSFILYLMCAYFLVILPLPSIDYVASLTSRATQLVPFNAIADIISNTSLILSDPTTYLSALNSPVVYQVLFNIIITIPFGMYLRYYFKCSFIKTLLYSFLLTLFFELTQLSGLYGIYPRSYRLFDVDDLITNTLGGIIGYFLIYPVSLFLPSRDEIDKTAYERGMQLSFPRRIIMILIDLFFIILIYIMILMWAYLLKIQVSNYLFDFIFLLYYITTTLCLKGCTLGKLFLNIKLVTLDDNTPKWYQYSIRYFLLYIVIILLPRISWGVIHQEYIINRMGMNTFIVLQGLVISIYIIMYIYFIYILFQKRMLWYENLSKTKDISTISDKIKDIKETVKENTMLNKNLPYYDIIMKADMDIASNLENSSLPEGYSYKAYSIGDEKHWAALEFEVNEFESLEKANAYFDRVFRPFIDILPQRIFFILDENKNYVATSSAWFKDDQIRHYALLHWVSVSPSQQGKGLGSKIVKYALSQFKLVEKEEKEIFLHTQTWSYKAISLYYKCGFYITKTPLLECTTDMKCIDVLKSVLDDTLVDSFIEK